VDQEGEVEVVPEVAVDIVGEDVVEAAVEAAVESVEEDVGEAAEEVGVLAEGIVEVRWVVLVRAFRVSIGAH